MIGQKEYKGNIPFYNIQEGEMAKEKGRLIKNIGIGILVFTLIVFIWGIFFIPYIRIQQIQINLIPLGILTLIAGISGLILAKSLK